MPYAYSVAGERSRAQRETSGRAGPPTGGRARRSVAAAAAVGLVCVAGTVAGIAAALLPAGRAPSAAAAGVRRALVEANVVEENLGAPAPGLPVAAAERTFVLGSHPVLGRGRVVGGVPPPRARPLGADAARAVLAGQGAVLRALFGGALLRRERASLALLVTDETRRAGARVGPGGARVVRWYSVQVHGAAARAEALVARWEQWDHVVAVSGTRRYSTQVVAEEIDALGTLRREGGRWRVVSLAEAPWQEPT